MKTKLITKVKAVIIAILVVTLGVLMANIQMANDEFNYKLAEKFTFLFIANLGIVIFLVGKFFNNKSL